MTISKAVSIIDDLVFEHGWNVWRAIKSVSRRHGINVGFLVNEVSYRTPTLSTSVVKVED